MKTHERTVTLNQTIKRIDSQDFEEGDPPVDDECGPWYLHEENGSTYACKQCVAGHPPTAFPYTRCIQLD